MDSRAYDTNMNENNNTNGLHGFSTDLVELATTAERFVAMVGGNGVIPRSATAIGSGFYVTAALDGMPGETIRVVVAGEREFTATVIEFWPREHLALISSDDGATAEGALAVLETEEEPMPLGSVVVTVAYPSPEGPEMRLGVVRCVGRDGDYIQTDDPPFPGFAGAPVVDTAGRLVGVTRLGAGGNQSQVATIRGLAAILRGERTAPRRQGAPVGLGIQTHGVALPESARAVLASNQESGLFVADLLPEGGAAEAGVLFGDVIVAVDGRAVTGPQELHERLEERASGETVEVRLLRGGSIVPVTVTLTELATETPGRDDAEQGHRGDECCGHGGGHRGHGRRGGNHGHGRGRWGAWSARRMMG